MNLFEDHSRRRFVKTFVVGTAMAVAFGKPWRGAFVAEASPMAAGSNFGILQVQLSDFPLLHEEFSSVRIGVNGIEDNSSGPLGFFYPIVISRGAGDQFYAVDAGCTHAGCVVPPYDNIEEAIICPCHGSTYKIDGTLIGGKASSSLLKMDISFDGVNMLTIKVPFLGYSVTGSVVQSDGTPRFQLDFFAYPGVEYEVKFQQRMKTPWTVVPFSTSLDSAPDRLSLVGAEQPVSIFVERTAPTGFFAVAMKLMDLTET